MQSRHLLRQPLPYGYQVVKCRSECDTHLHPILFQHERGLCTDATQDAAQHKNATKIHQKLPNAGKNPRDVRVPYPRVCFDEPRSVFDYEFSARNRHTSNKDPAGRAE